MSTRTGFIMRSFLPLGPLVIVFPSEDLYKEGKGRLTEIAVTTKRAPCSIIRRTRWRRPC
jgi:hypothetical protein